MWRYINEVQVQGKRPDAVIASAKTDTLNVHTGLTELTVPWEGRMEVSNCLKEERYCELALDPKDK